MKYVLTFIAISCYTVLQASLNYPIIFSSQGTVLYESAKDIAKFKELPSYEKEVSKYLEELESTKKSGYKADISDDKKEKMVYLKELRTLQTKQDRILNRSMRDLNTYINKNDYKNFLKMVNIAIPHYSQKTILQEKIFSYYKKNKNQKKNKILDKLIRKNKSIKIHYATRRADIKVPDTIVEIVQEQSTKKEIILLSRPGCSYCVKAKHLLDSTGNRYKEYNVKKSKGAKLYKKYNGNGVPVIVIGDKVIKGFNASSILAALK